MEKYKEPQGLKNVAKFHDAFGLPIEKEPIIPAKQRCELRVNLLQEELDELKEAIADNDLVEVADALSDIQYVLSGAILEFGLADKFNDLFEEVQRSNMSKICKNLDEARMTQEYYKKEKGMSSHVVEKDGQFFVYRDEDKKVLKSINYSPADLGTIIKKA